MGLNFEIKHRKALLNIGSLCNNNCVFCNRANARFVDANLNTLECMRRIEGIAGIGLDMVVFSGGEPTIRKDIISLCEYAGEHGLACGLITNGRMFSYKNFVDKLVSAGVEYVVVSLHGDNADIHDRHVRAKAFQQTIKGLLHISETPVQMVVKTILSRHNIDRLGKIRQLLKNFSPLHHTISLPSPDFDFALPLKDAATSIYDFLRSPDTEDDNISIGIEGFTPCLIEDFFKLNDDIFTQGFCLVREPEDSDWAMPVYRDYSFLQTCLLCSLYHLCPGIHKKYIEKSPELKLTPVKQTIRNVIDFRLHSESQLSNENDKLCDMLELQKPDPPRWISVKESGKILLFNTQETRTNVLELLRIKFDLEMVYLCGNGENNNRSADKLVKMQLEKDCINCARKTQCGGLFVRSENQMVSDEQENTRKIINLLHGRICEVGCGDGGRRIYHPGFPISKNEWESMYSTDQPQAAIHSNFELFNKLIENKHISFYAGVDPCLPGGETPVMRKDFRAYSSRFEDFKWDEAPFDVVIMYRSYDHLEDLDISLKLLASILHPEGHVIITENNPMIYLNMPKPVAKNSNHVITSPFSQHYRNHTAEEALRKLQEFGFKKVDQWSSHQTPNKFWTIVAKKI